MTAPSKPVRAGLVLLLVVLAGLGAWRLWAPRAADAERLTGYVEADPLYLSSPVGGALASVGVVQGQAVEGGEVLFQVRPDPLAAQRAQAAAALSGAEALAADARKGQRPEELAVYDAELAAARARLDAAEADLSRVEPLAARGIHAPARLDQARAVRDAARAELAAALRRRDAARLGARTDRLAAAEADAARARGGLAEVEARLADLSPRAPGPARVEAVYLQPGEWAAPNQPVVSLLPADRVKVRFFVPETAVARYRPGRAVAFECDGCAAGLKARIDYVAPRPEFTPPVIYSRRTRGRLVFMVEARPLDPAGLVPGLPVDVLPLGPEPGR